MKLKRPCDNRRVSGMTLIEVLVAFVILGMVMGVIMRINATSVRNHHVSKGYLRALQVAESRMEAMSLDSASLSLNQSGVEANGVYWEFSRRPYRAWSEQRLQNLSAVPVEERISVGWGEQSASRQLVFSRINLIYAVR
jgi:general secretion pathway protein I